MLGACAHGKESYVLDEYVMQVGTDHAEAQHAVINAEPVLMENCTDAASSVSKAALIDRVQFAQTMIRAISDVTGTAVTRIIFVDPASANGESGGDMDGSLNPGCERCRIGKSYVAYLAERHANTVKNALGVAGWSKLDYRVRTTLQGVCEPGVQETMFYYLAYAAYLPNDARRPQGFETIVTHLQMAVPLGEKAGEPGAWYVKVR
jgi:hypothetical protein